MHTEFQMTLQIFNETSLQILNVHSEFSLRGEGDGRGERRATGDWEERDRLQ